MWEIRKKRQTNENGNKPVQNRGDIEGKVVPTNVRLNCKTTFPVETPPLKEQYNKEHFTRYLESFSSKRSKKVLGNAQHCSLREDAEESKTWESMDEEEETLKSFNQDYFQQSLS